MNSPLVPDDFLGLKAVHYTLEKPFFDTVARRVDTVFLKSKFIYRQDAKTNQERQVFLNFSPALAGGARVASYALLGDLGDCFF